MDPSGRGNAVPNGGGTVPGRRSRNETTVGGRTGTDETTAGAPRKTVDMSRERTEGTDAGRD
ncbi:hypothetical protein Pen02_21540 [Plantactinospora endophytica]|uniref:Uncharacterized protein n=1 Tax=Plantactinospora endophytica TaxID=673535 RepID=A0ABQ4DXN5_9ACTN|nr:hypothetical protein Pen02_21540 [Plantactinospora endophytica]